MMKKINVLFFVFITIAVSHCKVFSQNVQVMTYNIRYDSEHDGEDIWINRKQGLVELLKAYKPDVFGIQEGLKHQIDFIDDHLGNYKKIGIGRDGQENGEFTAIFYNDIKFKLLKTETFWLSETPDVVSMGWDAKYNRTCTVGWFEHKTTKAKWVVFNTHFDHIGKQARLKSAELIISKISKNIKSPVVLMGDFNSEISDAPIVEIMKYFEDGKEISKTDFEGPLGTFNGFNKNAVLDKRIDYIFAKGFDVINYRHIDDRIKNQHWPSDHLPVLAYLEFQNTAKK